MKLLRAVGGWVGGWGGRMSGWVGGWVRFTCGERGRAAEEEETEEEGVGGAVAG